MFSTQTFRPPPKTPQSWAPEKAHVPHFLGKKAKKGPAFVFFGGGFRGQKRGSQTGRLWPQKSSAYVFSSLYDEKALSLSVVFPTFRLSVNSCVFDWVRVIEATENDWEWLTVFEKWLKSTEFDWKSMSVCGKAVGLAKKNELLKFRTDDGAKQHLTLKCELQIWLANCNIT